MARCLVKTFSKRNVMRHKMDERLWHNFQPISADFQTPSVPKGQCWPVRSSNITTQVLWMIFPCLPQVEQEWMETHKSKRDLECGLNFLNTSTRQLPAWAGDMDSLLQHTNPRGEHLAPKYLVLEMGLCAVLPLLKHLGQFIQATVVKMEDLVLALPARHHQLPTGTGLITVGTMQNSLQGPPARGGTSRDPGERQTGHKVPHRAAPWNRAQRHLCCLELTDLYGSLPVETFYDCMTWSWWQFSPLVPGNSTIFTLPSHEGIKICLPWRKNHRKSAPETLRQYTKSAPRDAQTCSHTALSKETGSESKKRE